MTNHYCSNVQNLIAQKVTSVKARLYFTTQELWEPENGSVRARFKVQVVSSGNTYYGSIFNIDSLTQYSRDWSFSGVNSVIRWWVQLIFVDGFVCYGAEGPQFYVPM